RQAIRAQKGELLALLGRPREAAPSPSAGGWDQTAAHALLARLRQELRRLERRHFSGRFPEPLRPGVADGLAIAEGFSADHELEARRGWDALDLLRWTQGRLLQTVERVRVHPEHLAPVTVQALPRRRRAGDGERLGDLFDQRQMSA